MVRHPAISYRSRANFLLGIKKQRKEIEVENPLRAGAGGKIDQAKNVVGEGCSRAEVTMQGDSEKIPHFLPYGLYVFQVTRS